MYIFIHTLVYIISWSKFLDIHRRYIKNSSYLINLDTNDFNNRVPNSDGLNNKEDILYYVDDTFKDKVGFTCNLTQQFLMLIRTPNVLETACVLLSLSQLCVEGRFPHADKNGLSHSQRKTMSICSRITGRSLGIHSDSSFQKQVAKEIKSIDSLSFRTLP